MTETIEKAFAQTEESLNQGRWELAMLDEIIVMLDILIVVVATNQIVQIIFILKAIADFATTIKKASKVKR